MEGFDIGPRREISSLARSKYWRCLLRKTCGCRRNEKRCARKNLSWTAGMLARAASAAGVKAMDDREHFGSLTPPFAWTAIFLIAGSRRLDNLPDLNASEPA